MRLPLPRGRMLELAPLPLVMGIINVTPDSFSDGGAHFDRADATRSALQMVADGAAIIDIGGESTRPGSLPVSADEELDRVLPVIRALRDRSDIAISIDTAKATVAAEALDAGADIVNDVTSLRDPEMAGVVRKHGAAVVLMHMRGEPRTMQETIHFDDLIGEIAAELRERRDAAVSAGISTDAVLVDPGIGFGKTFAQNAEILRRAGELTTIAPLVIGASRKGFIGHLTGQPGGSARMAGSLAAVAAAAAAGATIVRVHDVRETVDFLNVYRAIQQGAA